MSASSILVIAEAGVNHNGSVDSAVSLVRAAREARADVVKFQHFRAETIVARGTATAAYQKSNTGTSDQFELLKALELDLDDFAVIAGVCREEGIEFLCTAFDMNDAAALAGLGQRRVKIPSGELTNAPMLSAYAKLGLPVVLSTGMSTLDEVGEALAVLDNAGASLVTLLHCTSQYPAPPEALNLKAIATMRDRFARPVGYSDHSLGDHAAVTAVALGACVIEKHFTLDCSLPGPDHKSSLEPAALATMIDRIRDVERMLGDGVKRPTVAEIETARLVRRSWHAARDLSPGHRIGAGDVMLMRPAHGLAPSVDPIGMIVTAPIACSAPVLARDVSAA